MAALTSIRSKGKLIAICVGGALLAFVLGDFINSGATIFGASQTKVGEINGTSIDYNEFQAKVNERETFIKLASGRSTVDAETSDQIREYCWDQTVRENTLAKNANEQGVIVTDAEIAAMIQSGNVTPTIRQAFSNPQTGIYDPNYVAMFIQQGDAQSRFIWQNMEQELRESQQYNKYLNMIAQGLYITNAEVEREFANRTQLSDIKYVAIPYSDIKDDEVSVTEADLKDVYNKNIKRLERFQETRDLAYVAFDVIPSEKDSAAALEDVNKVKDGLAQAAANEVENYINSKSDVPFSNYHYSKGDIQNPVVDSLMFAEQPGFVYGPYVEGEYYKVARLINTEMLPDSVKASHILIAFRNPADSVAAKAKADSLLDVYKSGIDFGALAMQFSDDQGSQKDSGNLGWIVERTPFIPEFKDACFATDKGKTTVVKSSYGYHIIKVTDKTAPKRKALVGFAQIEIRPSSQTRQMVYSKASEFAGVNRKPAEFEAAIQSNGLIRRIAPNLLANSRGISGIENSRELVRWAFNDDESKEVSDVKEFGDRYIVAALSAVHAKGVPSFNEAKQMLTLEATNNVKAGAIMNKIQGASGVDAVAAKMGKTAQEARNVNFEMAQIPGIGFEPAVIAVASSLGQNQVSAPVKGINGVYVLENTSFTPAQAIQPLNVTTDKTQMLNEIQYRAVYQVPQALTKMANIVDKRVKFF